MIVSIKISGVNNMDNVENNDNKENKINMDGEEKNKPLKKRGRKSSTSKTPKKKMSEEDKVAFNKIYFEIKDIMGYGEKQPLSRQQILRLRGLHSGKFMDNKYIESYAPDVSVDYDVILLAIQIKKRHLKEVLAKQAFNDDNHKFNYVCKVIELNLGEAYKIKRKREIENNANNALDNFGLLTARGTEEYKKMHEDSKLSIFAEDVWGDI